MTDLQAFQDQDTQDEAPRFRPRGRIIRADEVRAWETGQSYLEAAKREARRIRREAADTLNEEKRRGFEEGRLEGAQSAAKLLMETKVKADRYLADADGQIIDLAMAVVQRVLGNLDAKDLILQAVHHALAKQRRDQPLTLHVSPKIAEQLRQQMRDAFGEGDAHLITVEPDPRLEIDECRAASEIGFVELGLKAQIQALHQGLRDGLKRPDGE